MLKTFEEIKKTGFDFDELETERKIIIAKRRKKNFIPIVVSFGITIVGLILMLNSIYTIGTILFIAGLIVLASWTTNINQRYKSILKNNIINNLLKKIDNSFSYKLADSKENKYFNKKIEESSFMDSYATSSVNGVFKGKILGLNFTLGDTIITELNSTTFSFQGAFAVIETKNNYPFTAIVPGSSKSLSNKFNKLSKTGRRNQKIIKFKQDSKFEKSYTVWAYDDNGIQQIISPELREHLKSPLIYLTFSGNQIFFGCDERRYIFKMNLLKKIKESTIKHFYDEFSKYYNMIEKIIILMQ